MRLSEELMEALRSFVRADIQLRQSALTGSGYERRVEEWDRAASNVARRAQAAGIFGEGI